jgi:hypothetical protein
MKAKIKKGFTLIEMRVSKTIQKRLSEVPLDSHFVFV